MAGLEKIATDERVFDIAARLVAQGRKVSNHMVWDQVGGGYMMTIAEGAAPLAERSGCLWRSLARIPKTRCLL